MNTSVISIAYVGFLLLTFVSTVYGIFLGFAAHLVLGLTYLVAPPLAFFTGLIALLTDYDLAQAIVNSLG